MESVNGWGSWHFQWVWGCHVHRQESQKAADGLATAQLVKRAREPLRGSWSVGWLWRGSQESIFDLGGKRIKRLKQFTEELISRETGYLANCLFSWIDRYDRNYSNTSQRMSSLFPGVLYLLKSKSHWGPGWKYLFIYYALFLLCL